MINNRNVSVSLALFLVVLLTQSRSFDFLLETAWGRFVLIMLIMVISYFNKILGSVVVLFVIIMFNHSDAAFFEGFTSKSSNNSTDASGNSVDASGNSVDASGNSVDASGNRVDASGNRVDASGNRVDASGNSLDASGNNSNHKPNKNKNVNPMPTPPSNITSNAKEGFDLIGTENTIKRGKQSNSIPVKNSRSDNVDVSPYEGFVNNHTFSSI
jgi:hypothetical protein